MRIAVLCLVTVALCLPITAVRADEMAEAEALASAAQGFLEKGKTESAREYLFKALFHSDRCAIALYELGKIYQAENNNAAASDFLTRALHEMKNLENSRPEFSGKITDAKVRLQAVNPYGAQFNTSMEDYSQELCRIIKKSNDALTNEEAGHRVSSLNLASIVPASKLPEIEKPVAKNDNARRPTSSSSNNPMSRQNEESAPVQTVVPLDVERALKAAGWTKITGVWKKKSEGVYEVTDGRLETEKINGALQFSYASGPGTVTAFVRNNNKDPYMHSSGMGAGNSSSGIGFTRFSWVSGYGVVLNDRDCKAYTPQGGFTNNEYYPGLDHTGTLQQIPKHQIMITVQEDPNGKATTLTALVDGKKEINTRYKLNKDGPFTIEIKGTMVIEDPKTMGQ